MKKFGTIYIFALIAFVIITSINNKNLKAGDDSSKFHITADSVCFSRDILPLINSNCANSGCHDPITHAEGYNLTNYTNIMRLVKAGSPSTSKLYSQIKNNSMPPSGYTKLTADQKALISTWISQGAKNSNCPPNGCDITNITYTGTIKPILATYCMGCHSGSNPGGGYVFTNDTTAQGLYNQILAGASHQAGVNAMPPNIALMDSCYLMKIKAWANQSASTNCDTTNVTYSGSILPILKSQCYSCHQGVNSTSGIDLSTEKNVNLYKNLILSDVNWEPGFNKMPQNTAQLDACSLAKIRIWATTEDAVNDDISEPFGLNVFPNPANQILNINYNISTTQSVNFEIWDFKGNRVISITKANINSGSHTEQLQLSNHLQNGVYLCKITANNQSFSKKFSIIR